MANISGPRLLRSGEFDELMALLDRSFSYERGGIAARYPHVYDPEQPKRHAVITVDGDIVSHAACIPETLVLDGGAEVACAGIGGVATAKPHRDNGYMSQLLEFWLDWMDDEGVLLSELGGDRTRYGHFGWERTAPEVVYTLTERSMGSVSPAGDVSVYDGDGSDLEALQRLHASRTPRVDRDAATAAAIYGQRGLDTLLYREDGTCQAYVCLSREQRRRTIREFGGGAEGIRAILGYCLRWWDAERFTVYVNSTDPRNTLFEELASSWRVQPSRLLNVRNLPALLDAYEHSLSRTWEHRGNGGSEQLVLGVADDDRAVRLTCNAEGLSVIPVEEDPTVALDRMAAARLCFGGPGRMHHLRTDHPVLDTIFPLDFAIWPSERV